MDDWSSVSDEPFLLPSDLFPCACGTARSALKTAARSSARKGIAMVAREMDAGYKRPPTAAKEKEMKGKEIDAAVVQVSKPV